MGHSCKLKALGAFGKLRSAKIDPHSREPLSDAAYCSYFESSQNFHLWKTSLPSEGKKCHSHRMRHQVSKWFRSLDFGSKISRKLPLDGMKMVRDWLEGVMQNACCSQVVHLHSTPHLASLTKKLLRERCKMKKKNYKMLSSPFAGWNICQFLDSMDLAQVEIKRLLMNVRVGKS